MREEKLYTVNEAAARLNVHRATIYEWMRTGKLRFVIVGQRRRIPQSAIDEFIKAGGPTLDTRKPDEENFMPGLVVALRTQPVPGSL